MANDNTSQTSIPNEQTMTDNENKENVKTFNPTLNPNLNITEAIQLSMQDARRRNKLICGLNQCLNHIESQQSRTRLCVVSNQVDVQLYSKLIGAITTEHNVPLIKVDSPYMLAEWAGLGTYDRDGQFKSTKNGCSVAVITDWDSKAEYNFAIENYINYYRKQKKLKKEAQRRHMQEQAELSRSHNRFYHIKRSESLLSESMSDQ